MSTTKKIIGLIGATLILILLIIGKHVFNEMGALYTDKENTVKYGHYPYYSTTENQFLSPETLVFFPERVTGGNAGMKRFFTKSPNAPQKQLPIITLQKSDYLSEPSPYAIYWLGHSSAMLEIDKIRILIDPVLDNAAPFPGVNPRFSPSPIQRQELPPIDIVLLTHDHYDHLEARTMKYLKDKETHFIAPLGVGARLKGWGIHSDKITEIAWDETFTLSTLQITATPGIHYSGRSQTDKNKTLWAGYALKGKDKNIFWSGDSGYGTHFKEIGEKYGPFDLACVEIDAWNNGWPNTHLFPKEVIQVCQDVKAGILLPTHWAVFDMALHPWDESIRQVYSLARQNQIEILTPLMGEKVIPGETQTGAWWETYTTKR